MSDSISNEARAAKRAAKIKQNRDKRKAKVKAKREAARARDARIKAYNTGSSPEQRKERLDAFLKGLPAPKQERLPEDQPWTWDSRIKPPEGNR